MKLASLIEPEALKSFFLFFFLIIFIKDYQPDAGIHVSHYMLQPLSTASAETVNGKT